MEVFVENPTMYEILLIVAGIVGVYVKFNNDLSKIKNRVYTLEQTKDEVKDMLKDLQEDLAEIKLLLARNQIGS